MRLLLLLALLLAACHAEPAAVVEPVPDEDKIRAVTFDARQPPEPDALRHLRDLGVTHVGLTTFGFQEAYDVPEIRLHTDGGWYSETDEGIRALAAEARALDLGLIIKPHVWVGRYSADGQERHRIAFQQEADWQRWEAAYTRLLLHYARLARDVDADVLVLGTELLGAVRARPAFWRALADSVHTVYDGDLTYAANWYEEAEAVLFWDALDYVGVQAYFPLVEEGERPTPERLREGWDEHLVALRRLSARAGRPVLFTEIGYRSVGYAAEAPWRWPERGEAAVSDAALQAALYEAFFDRVWRQPWLAGAVVWKWHPSAEGDRPLGFTPQGKLAEDVLRRRWAAASP